MPIVKQAPNWLLCFIGTVFWRVDKIRNAIWPEIKSRWPVVFLDLWHGKVIVKTK